MSNRKGFTLIEMLIVIAIIGIVLSIAYPSLARTYDSSKENDRARQEIVVNKALIQYYALTGTYPNQGHDISVSGSTLSTAELLLLTAKTPGNTKSLFYQTGVALDAAYTSTRAATFEDTFVDVVDGHVKGKISSLQVDYPR